jgi:hypothetical protein
MRRAAQTFICIALGTAVYGTENERRVGPRTSTGATAASPELQAVLSFEVYRILGDISGDLSLTDSVWPNSDARADSIRKGFTFFTVADLEIAGVEFNAGGDGWTWNGGRKPPGTERILLLSSPVVIARFRERFELRIGTDQPVAYFEKRPDGLFELKTTDVELGLTVTATAKDGGENRIVLEGLQIEFRSIQGREPIDGVPLDVGAPKIEAEEYTATVSLRAGKDYGLQIRTEGKGVLLIRMRADLARAKG